MARFKDVLSGLAENAAEGLPEDAWDSLGGAYDEDMAEFTASATARTNELSQQLGEATAALEHQKARNYDLLMSVPANDDQTAEETEPEPEQGIDSMFE